MNIVKGLYRGIKFFLASLFIKKKIKIGLSIIIANEIQLEKNIRIGHFNVIIVNKIIMKEGAYIGNFNFIKGNFNLIMEECASINLQNKITSILSPQSTYQISKLYLKAYSKIGVKHLLDLTDSITIGSYSMLAGSDSQIWTHGFYFSKQGNKVSRIDGNVYIGNNCYIATRCVICAGVSINDAITLGANSCVSKNLTKQGLYVNQALRFIEFDPDIDIKKFGNPISIINDVNIYKK